MGKWVLGIIRIKDKISVDLALRDIADSFFDKLEKMNREDIILDFSEIRSISRSFAHQYIKRKKQSSKNIMELNMSSNIEKMFSIVNSYNQKTNLLDLDSMKVMTI